LSPAISPERPSERPGTIIARSWFYLDLGGNVMRHTHRILVVDDDVGVRDLFADVLQRSGADVTTAADGSEAVAQVAGGLDPCLVLADVLMPRLDGWEMERALQKLAPGLPVVLLTSDRLLTIRAPALDKPISAAEIESLARTYCPATRHHAEEGAKQAG
jgi:CheY-like chemotaxis protein